MGISSVATKASRAHIKACNKREKEGEDVDWDKEFEIVKTLEAKGKDAQVKAIMEKKR